MSLIMCEDAKACSWSYDVGPSNEALKKPESTFAHDPVSDGTSRAGSTLEPVVLDLAGHTRVARVRFARMKWRPAHFASSDEALRAGAALVGALVV